MEERLLPWVAGPEDISTAALGSGQGLLGQDRHGGLVNPAVPNMSATGITPQTLVPLSSDPLGRQA